jgi:hypothetical protein
MVIAETGVSLGHGYVALPTCGYNRLCRVASGGGASGNVTRAFGSGRRCKARDELTGQISNLSHRMVAGLGWLHARDTW